MAYADVTVIVDGALEEQQSFTDYLLQNEYIEQIKAEALGDGYPTEIYVLEHDHDPNDDYCACAQYRTDHHPYWSHNVG
jgi:hypothetical protein